MKTVFVSTLLITALASGQENPKPTEQECRTHLQTLGQALKLYLIYNDGRLPATIGELHKQGFVPDLSAFCCPASNTRLTDSSKIDEESDYLMITNAADEKPLLLFKERSGFHEGHALAFYSDHSIRKLSITNVTVSLPPATDAAATITKVNEFILKSDFQNARPLLEQLVRQQRDNPEFHIGLGRALNWLGDLDGAFAAFEKGFRLAPQTPNIRSWLGELSIHKGDYQAAHRWLSEELAANPKSALAHSYMGTLYLQSGDTANRNRGFQAAVNLDPNIALARYDNATTLQAKGQYVRAIIEYVSSVHLNPNLPGSYFGLGACYSALHQKSAAIQAYERFMQLDATSEWATQASQELLRLKSLP